MLPGDAEMKIIVPVKELRAEIEAALKDYDVEYEKVLQLYQQKLEKYMTYLDKEIASIIKSKKPTQLKSPPYPPSWLRNNFVETFEVLKVHQGDSVEMNDREYSDLKKGITRLRDDIQNVTMHLNTLEY